MMTYNYRGALSQWVKRNRERAPQLPEFTDLGVTGADIRDKIYHIKCEFIVDGKLLTTSCSARRKKMAYRDCARRMLEKIEKLPKPGQEVTGDSRVDGFWLCGTKVRAKYGDQDQWYDGVVAKNHRNNQYNIFWPQYRDVSENVPEQCIQGMRGRKYHSGRLRVRDGKAGIDVVCQPKGIVITNKGDQPDLENNDTIVSINECNLKGLMPTDQAKVWKEHMSNGAEFVVERPVIFKRQELVPLGDTQAVHFYYKKNRFLLSGPVQYNLIEDAKLIPRFTVECVIEYKDGTVLRVEGTSTSKKKAKQEAAKKMVEKLGDKINQVGSSASGGSVKRRRSQSADPDRPNKKLKEAPIHEKLQKEAEESYQQYLELANKGDQDAAQVYYKKYESTYKQYADEYRRWAEEEDDD